MERLIAILHRVSRVAVWIGGTLLLASVFLISVEVVLRKLFAVSTGGADELSGYAFCISTSWAMSFALLERAHLRIDALYTHLPSWIGAILDFLALVALTGAAVIINVLVFKAVSETYTLSAVSNTQLGIPLWIPQSLWLVGFMLFLVASSVLFLRACSALVAGNYKAIENIFGVKTIDEEIEEETQGRETG